MWTAFGVQIWPACLHPCKYPYNLIEWGGIWRGHSCYIMFLDSYLKPSCTWMLICTVHSDVLIIFLLKTCWHYPGVPEMLMLLFQSNLAPWGRWGFLFALPGLQGGCGDATLWDGHSQLLRPPQEAQGAWTVTIISRVTFFGEIETTSILSFTFSFGQFTCGPSSPFPQFLSPSASQSKSGSELMISSQQMKSSGAWLRTIWTLNYAPLHACRT